MYRVSDMILVAHSDTGFCNEYKGRSQAGSHIFLSEDNPIPRWNGPVLSIYQVIKFVMTSTAEAKLGVLYITAQKMVPMRQIFIEMEWMQPPTPIQTYNTTAEGVVNNTIVAKKKEVYGITATLITMSRGTKTISFLLGQRTQQLG